LTSVGFPLHGHPADRRSKWRPDLTGRARRIAQSQARMIIPESRRDARRIVPARTCES
jgi:hypothetical protein